MGGSDQQDQQGGDHRQTRRNGRGGQKPRGGAASAAGPASGNDLQRSGPGVGSDAATAAWTARFTEQFFKTKICSFWQKGQCMRGAACKYAHGVHEINEMPDLTNTALCHQMLAYGKCNDPNCHFAHSPEALRATGNFYKTTMCSFHRYGRCSLGNRCRHAHSESELRKAQASQQMQREAESRLAYAKAMARRPPLPEDSEDEFGEVPQWTRTCTMPADLGQPPPMRFNAPPRNFAPQRPPAREDPSHERVAWRSMGSDDEDDLGEVPTWTRTVTVPASSGKYSSNSLPLRHAPQRQQYASASLGSLDSLDELGEVPTWQRTMSVPSQRMGLPSHSQHVDISSFNRQDFTGAVGCCGGAPHFQQMQQQLQPKQQHQQQQQQMQQQPAFPRGAAMHGQGQYQAPPLDDEDDFDDVNNMWFRMQTVPPPATSVHPQQAWMGRSRAMMCESVPSGAATTMGSIASVVTNSTEPWSRQVSAAGILETSSLIAMQPAPAAMHMGQERMDAMAMPAVNVAAGGPVLVMQVPTVLVAASMQHGAPMQHQVLMTNQDQAMMKQLEAQLLERAMPEHYDD